ncbi:hypothetical protein RN001_006346 [Aquatica leii]|uniref:Gustatory receptor n=1 Tax=Aquatica leii TaxID=1421715 RepID=A0AAN7Q3S2_9COLE|nr:hypothetical protein RN001_006346 [Aquatica leii]
MSGKRSLKPKELQQFAEMNEDEWEDFLSDNSDDDVDYEFSSEESSTSEESDQDLVRQRLSILAVFESLNNFDKRAKEIFRINLNKEYEKAKFHTFFGTVTIITLAIAMLILTGFSTEASREVSLAKFVCLIVPPLVSTLINIQICVLSLNLKRRFFWINQQIGAIQKMLYRNVCNIHTVLTDDFCKNQASFKLMNIKQAHFQLCSICKKFNNAFALQVSVVVAQHYVIIVILIIYVGRQFIIEPELTVKYVVFVFTQMSWSLLQLFCMIIFCSSTANEVFFFSLQLLHENVEFTACRCFVVNETLLFTLAGATTTYLIVIIQFDIA